MHKIINLFLEIKEVIIRIYSKLEILNRNNNKFYITSKSKSNTFYFNTPFSYFHQKIKLVVFKLYDS